MHNQRRAAMPSRCGVSVLGAQALCADTRATKMQAVKHIEPASTEQNRYIQNQRRHGLHRFCVSSKARRRRLKHRAQQPTVGRAVGDVSQAIRQASGGRT